jgi:acyl-CoA reductase-like NAD-dependent aldehyde dehydrogenase
MRTTAPADLDRALAVLTGTKQRWPHVPIPERIALLRCCIAGCVAVADDMAIAGCRAKGLDPESPAGAEEWLSGPVPVIRNLRLLVETLSDLARTEHPHARAGGGQRRRGEALAPPLGNSSVRVFPRDRFDRVFYPGVTIDVWLETPEPTFVPRQAAGAVVLVLGAGNVASIGLMDLLYKLVVEDHVVVLKMHPINDYLGPHVERAFAALIEAGFLRIVYGDADVGQYLVTHPSVDQIHLTGSAAVHDRIAAATAKPMTSELGCVTPVIVTPGGWSEAEVAYQAENVATMVALNASCNCNAAKLIVTWRDWPQRRAFLDRIAGLLSSLPPRLAYYPGSAEKYDRLLARHRNSRPQGRYSGSGRMLPFVTLFDVDPDRHDDPVFKEEAWSPILAETALAADDPVAFLDHAVRFCNEHVSGTLSMVMLADPRSRAHLGAAFDRAVADLEYGTVAINQWSALSYALAVAPWGAYPGHTRDAVGSGIGVVHNTQMLDRVIKTVLVAPFTTRPKPPWFVTHRSAHLVARRLARFEASPSWWRVPAIARAAHRQ